MKATTKLSCKVCTLHRIGNRESKHLFINKIVLIIFSWQLFGTVGNLKKIILKGQKNMYPQLFSYDCCNIHSNAKDGSLTKVNLYNGAPDCLQINHSQCPIESLNVCTRVLDVVDQFPSQNTFVKDLTKIKDDSDQKVDSLVKNAENLKLSESAVRAEIRIPLSRALSLGPLLEHFIDDSYVQKNTLEFDI